MATSSEARTVGPVFDGLLDDVRTMDLHGEVADYIPELGTADPELLSITAASVSGRTYSSGDAEARFTIQSISKAFVYALALAEHGVEKVTEYVGVEPSGEPFNAISFDSRGRPANPMINAGAVVTTSLISAADADERFERIREGLSAFAARRLEPDESVYISESSTGDRNRALAMLASSQGVLRAQVDASTEPYFKQCSLLVDTTDLAVMGSTLANDGVNPISGETVVSAEVARNVLSLMSSCGMYDKSGQWLFNVGMPAKSGVGGGIVAVAPGEYGIGVFSPPLDSAGNSVRGVAMLSRLSEEFGLHLFRHPPRPVSPVSSIETGPSGVGLNVHLRGILDFVAAEQVVSEIFAAANFTTLSSAEERSITIDLSSVTAVTEVAAKLLHGLSMRAEVFGWRTTVVDPDGIAPR